MKVYVIKSTFVEKNIGPTKQSAWTNLYAVKTEKEAREDCIKFQKRDDDFYSTLHKKFVYIYEELTVY